METFLASSCIFTDFTTIKTCLTKGHRFFTVDEHDLNFIHCRTWLESQCGQNWVFSVLCVQCNSV